MSSLKLPPLYNDGLEFGTMSQISLSVTFVKNITAAVKFKAGLKWKSPHTHTFHSVNNQILREMGLKAGRERAGCSAAIRGSLVARLGGLWKATLNSEPWPR